MKITRCFCGLLVFLVSSSGAMEAGTADTQKENSPQEVKVEGTAQSADRGDSSASSEESSESNTSSNVSDSSSSD